MKPENIFSALSALRQEGRLRQVRDLRMETASLGTDREGKRYIVFNSNDYLGMTHAKEVQEAAAKAVRFGTGSGGARLTSGAAFELSDLEKEIADFKHTEDAVIFNTGYMANLGVLYALAGKGDVIFSDELNHASIVDGCRISKAETAVYRHSDMADLERLLQTVPCEGQRFIVTDGVFSMDGDICPLPALAALKKDYRACLIVDDAHASGVIGRTGRGTAEYFQMTGIDVQVGTFSKAFGAEGGYIAASREICGYLRNTSRPFIFSTAISAVTGAAALAALRLLKADPEKYLGRLRENTAYMRNLLTETGVDIAAGDTPIIPVVVGDEKEALATAEACREVIVDVCETALLAALIGVSGSFKIPGLVPGTEFQLSAPIAVAICGVFGFKKYIIAGVLASLLSLALGTHTILNVTISMSFRLAVGAVWLLLGSSRLFYIISGPIGTTAARGAMTLLLGKGFYAMVAAALPGMAFTAATAWFVAGVLKRVRSIRKR